MVLAEIHANPTRVVGWFNEKLQKAWKCIFPLAEVSAKESGLLLTDPAWKEAKNPWWQFLTDLLITEEERFLVWESLPQSSPIPILCE